LKTDDLIEALSLDLEPVAPVRPRLAAAATAGGLVTLGLVALWLGFRPDLSHAPMTRMFWTKALYTSLLGVAGFLAVDRLARPAGSPRRGLMLAACVFAFLVLAGAWQMMAATPADRMPMLMGASWRVCPGNIFTLAIPILAIVLYVVRGLAPTRLSLAGAACGLFAGGLAATVYGLHCPEHTMAFVALWYSLGVALAAALGAILGPWALRWR
jgi:hypothetical protein